MIRDVLQLYMHSYILWFSYAFRRVIVRDLPVIVVGTHKMSDAVTDYL